MGRARQWATKSNSPNAGRNRLARGLARLWAVLLGLVLFNESPDIWVIVGGLVIIGAISFITWREAVLNRRQITPLVGQTKL